MNKTYRILAFLCLCNISLQAHIDLSKSPQTKHSKHSNIQKKITQAIQYSRHIAKISGGLLLAYISFKISTALPKIKADSAQMITSQGNLLIHTAEDLGKLPKFALPKNRTKEMRKNAKALFGVANMLKTTSPVERGLPIITGISGLAIAIQGCDGLVKEIKKDKILLNSDEQN